MTVLALVLGLINDIIDFRGTVEDEGSTAETAGPREFVIVSSDGVLEFHEFLTENVGREVGIKATFDGHAVDYVSDGLQGMQSLDGSLESFSLVISGHEMLEGVQVNLVGLREDYLPNSFGWGAMLESGRGWELRGRYLVVDEGIGTGAIAWVALQAVSD